MTAPTLRQYQLELVERILRELDGGVKRLLVVAPTGSGKTVMFSPIAKYYESEGVLIISHRSEIIDQTAFAVAAVGARHGIIQAGKDDKLRPYAGIQVASIQTLDARAIRSRRMTLPRAGLIIIDECHHVRATTYQKLLEQYPNAKVLGFTATPCRGDGRGLGNDFDRMIQGPQVKALVELGFLVPSVVFSTPINLSGIRTVAGDYARGQLEDRMDNTRLVGDIVTQYRKYANGLKAVVFASGVGHSRHIADEFARAGIRAEHLDGTTLREDRLATLARLASGETTVVCNAMVLTEGWDCPSIECCILARPTKQMGLYRQMMGRVLRLSKETGKTRAVILDHAGAAHAHGLPQDHVEWTLDIDKKASCPEHVKREASSETAACTCSQCGATRCGGMPCPNCGFMPAKSKEYLPHIDADLVEVGKRRDTTTEERRSFYTQLLWIAREKNYKKGWAFYKAKEKYGIQPQGCPEPVEPTGETRAWVRSRNIAWAKSKNNPRNNGLFSGVAP
jgi:DNA repair protein RadD